MSQIIHQFALYLHILAGTVAIIVFWLPIIAKKGSAEHIRYGRYFTRGMYAVSISGFVMTILVLLDPIGVRAPARNLSIDEARNIAFQSRLFAGFLLMLSLLVLSSVRHSILVLRAKGNRKLLRTPLHLSLYFLLGLVALIMGCVGIVQGFVLYQIFSVLCVTNVIGTLRYIFKSNIQQREWIIAHLGAILGAGIGAYTAFFVFGGSRLLSEIFDGNGQLLFWVLPGVVGTIASAYYSRHYKRIYRVA